MAETIQQKVETIINDFLDMDPASKKFKRDAFEARMKQATIGMAYNRDVNMNERIKVGQMIRVISMISSDPAVRESYIKATQPGMVPQLESRPK